MTQPGPRYYVTFVDLDESLGSPRRAWSGWREALPPFGTPVLRPDRDGVRRYVRYVRRAQPDGNGVVRALASVNRGYISLLPGRWPDDPAEPQPTAAADSIWQTAGYAKVGAAR